MRVIAHLWTFMSPLAGRSGKWRSVANLDVCSWPFLVGER